MATDSDITLSSFSNAVRDLARANRFIVEISTPNEPDMKFFITKATIPQIDITGPEINYFGTKAMIAGDPKLEPLILGFLNDSDWKYRTYFEDWMRDIKKYDSKDNTGAALSKTSGSYRVGRKITIHQLGLGYKTIASYEFNNAVPLSMTGIDLDHNTPDVTENFDVTFYYTLFERGN